MSCRACKDTGWVRPSPFCNDHEPWAEWYETAVRLAVERGYPPSSSPTLSGSIAPIPCPRCGGSRVVPLSA